MGYDRHHGIIVTTFKKDYIEDAHREAERIFSTPVSEVCPESINGWLSFFVPPDGSKEGWDESDKGDHERDVFVAWLEGQRYEDGSSRFAWIEVQYGDGEGETKIVRDSDALQRAKRLRGN